MRGRRAKREGSEEPEPRVGGSFRVAHLVEFQTARIDEVLVVLRTWYQAVLDDRAAVWAALSKDRDRQHRYVWMLGVSSARSASALDAIPLERLRRQLAPHVDGQIVLRSLDIIGDGSRQFGQPTDVATAREVNAW